MLFSPEEVLAKRIQENNLGNREQLVTWLQEHMGYLSYNEMLAAKSLINEQRR